ncbi:MAG: DUF3592 domain-containing protein [Akkermansia sp.]|nr:DUF3592 domain-containing protein [Akkermansia sp.]
MKHLFLKLAGRRYHRLFLLAGLLMAAMALYHLAGTAMFVHEAVVLPAVVTDVVQKPYDDTMKALVHGSGSCPGDVSYQPLVRFNLPSGLVINRMMTDAGNDDYTIGQSIEIITPALDPSGARINQWKYIWGTETLELGVGVLLALVGFALRGTLLRRRAGRTHTESPKSADTPARTKRRNTAAGARKSSTPKRRKSTSAETAPPKRRSRRKKTE